MHIGLNSFSLAWKSQLFHVKWFKRFIARIFGLKTMQELFFSRVQHCIGSKPYFFSTNRTTKFAYEKKVVFHLRKSNQIERTEKSTVARLPPEDMQSCNTIAGSEMGCSICRKLWFHKRHEKSVDTIRKNHFNSTDLPRDIPHVHDINYIKRWTVVISRESKVCE